MLLRKFYIALWIRVIGILATCGVIAYVAANNPDWLYFVNLGVILIVQVLLLIRSQNILNRELETFVDTLRSGDLTTTFKSKSKDPALAVLREKLNHVVDHYKDMQLSNQSHNEYLRVLVEQINIGLISYDADGQVLLVNSAAKKLLGFGRLSSIQDLAQVNSSLPALVEELKPDEKKLVALNRGGYIMQLSVSASLLKFQGVQIKIISFQNIKSELDNREMEGWQKLIRVLTHELMNSAGPIHSTISTLMELLADVDDGKELPPDILADTLLGLKIIEERSHGMVDFVTRFRSLTLIPQPKFIEVTIKELFKSIQHLMHDNVKSKGASISFNILGGNLIALADRGMMEQILINLIRNALEAIKDVSNPAIKLSAWSDTNQFIYINVADNGVGIIESNQDKIFVPFFTTRKDGTGVGLSLSRQLASAQGGYLVLAESSSGSTVFTLKIRTAN